MGERLVKRIKSTAVVGLFKSGLGIIRGVVVAKLFLFYTTVEAYNNWIYTLGILAIGSILIIGEFQTYGNRINYAYHRNRERLHDIWNECTSNFIILCAFSILLILLYTYNKKVLSVSFGLVLFFAAHYVLLIVLRFYLRIYEPIGKIYAKAKLEFLIDITELSLLVLAIFFYRDWNWLLSCLALVKFFLAIALFRRIKKEHAVPRFTIDKFKPKFRFKNHANSLLLLTEKLFSEGFVVILAIFLLSSDMSAYGALRAIMNSSLSLSLVLIMIYLPEIQRLMALRDIRAKITISRIFLSFALVSLFVTVVIKKILPQYGFYMLGIINLPEWSVPLLLLIYILGLNIGLTQLLKIWNTHIELVVFSFIRVTGLVLAYIFSEDATHLMYTLAFVECVNFYWTSYNLGCFSYRSVFGKAIIIIPIMGTLLLYWI